MNRDPSPEATTPAGDPVPMTRAEAVRLLGGSLAQAARAIGIRVQSLYRWPDPLTPRLQDRVIAARWRIDQAQAQAAKLERLRQWAASQEQRAPTRARTPQQKDAYGQR